MKISLAFITGRADPRLDWLVEDLHKQADPDDDIELVVIDALGRPASQIGFQWLPCISALVESAPHPNVWQGEHRVTTRDWWAASAARNTAFVLATRNYIAFTDDRCHLGEGWLEAVRRGDRERTSVIAGAYDKLEDGRTTLDNRLQHAPSGQCNVGGQWLYGCTFALPLDWALAVNGFEEGCDGLSFEDVIFGLNLASSGYRIDYCPDLRVHQDRPAAQASTFRRTDKGVSPRDKSHAALERFGRRRRTEFTPDLRALRVEIASGRPWPVPDRVAEHRDWYDGQPIRDMV